MMFTKGYSAIAEWGRNYGKEISKALGFTHEKTPLQPSVIYSVNWKSNSWSPYWDNGLIAYPLV